jgi:hypothetical protein
MTTKAITDMNYEEWLHKDDSRLYHTLKIMTLADIKREGTTTEGVDEKLRKAVAYYLHLASKDVPGDKSGLYSAAALALIGEPVDEELLDVASEERSNLDPLYSTKFCTSSIPEIERVAVSLSRRDRRCGA